MIPSLQPTTFLKQNIEHCFDKSIGSKGLTSEKYTQLLEKTTPALRQISDDRGESGLLSCLNITSRTDDIIEAKTTLAQLLPGMKTLVILGTGGSSLGGQVLAKFAAYTRKPDIRIIFCDNLDPVSLSALFAGLPLETARFLVISKSGGTIETLTQACILLASLEKADLADLEGRVIGLSEPTDSESKNGLRDLLGAYGIPVLDHHPNIGGRFSVLSNVGQIVALAAGLDAFAIRRGAHETLEQLHNAIVPAEVPAAVGAALNVGMITECGIHNTVMFPYGDLFAPFANWYVQLWGESLGKDGNGSTPVAALGPRDQHSLLQLLMDGPAEHLTTFIRTPLAQYGPQLKMELAVLAGIGFLGDRNVGTVVEAQSKAIPDALLKVGRPIRTIDLVELNEESMGALFMHFMLEVIITAELMNVDPFGQPSVELGKKLTIDYLK